MLPEWITNLNDTDLSTLAYLCGQAEGRQEDSGCYLNGQPGVMAGQVQVEAKRREVARRVASVGRTFISLMAELEVQA